MPVSISATSALVLNWTDPKIWQSPLASKYMRDLDLSEGQSLLERFSAEENLMHTQTVSCRKFFVRKTVCDFLERMRHEGKSGQVLILAAGLAPMSVEIASLFPESAVFDVDLHNMCEKQELLGGHEPFDDFVGAARIKHLHAARAGGLGVRLGLRPAVEHRDHAGRAGVLQALQQLEELFPGRLGVAPLQPGEVRPGENGVVGVDQKEGFGHGAGFD